MYIDITKQVENQRNYVKKYVEAPIEVSTNFLNT